MRRDLIRSLVRKLRLERRFRNLGVPYDIEKVDELEAKVKKLQLAIEARDRDASGMRLLIASHVKTIEKFKTDLGRDEKIKEIRNLTLRVASLDRINTDLNDSVRTLSTEAAEARGRVQGLLDKLTTAEVERDDALQREKRALEEAERVEDRIKSAREAVRISAAAEAKRAAASEVELWKQRAVENGWVDPEARSERQKRLADRRESLKQQHPDWTDAQLDQFMDTIGRAIET